MITSSVAVGTGASDGIITDPFISIYVNYYQKKHKEER